MIFILAHEVGISGRLRAVNDTVGMMVLSGDYQPYFFDMLKESCPFCHFQSLLIF